MQRHDPPSPREGLRPRPRRPAGPQCQGLAYARAWGARHRQPGQHKGPITRAFLEVLEVLEALLWGFHNNRTGCCFPSYRGKSKLCLWGWLECSGRGGPDSGGDGQSSENELFMGQVLRQSAVLADERGLPRMQTSQSETLHTTWPSSSEAARARLKDGVE